MLALGPEQVMPKSTIRPRRFHNGSYEYHRELFLSNNDDKRYSLASEWSKTCHSVGVVRGNWNPGLNNILRIEPLQT